MIKTLNNSKSYTRCFISHSDVNVQRTKSIGKKQQFLKPGKSGSFSFQILAETLLYLFQQFVAFFQTFKKPSVRAKGNHLFIKKLTNHAQNLNNLGKDKITTVPVRMQIFQNIEIAVDDAKFTRSSQDNANETRL